jgi:hypothetical protein
VRARDAAHMLLQQHLTVSHSVFHLLYYPLPFTGIGPDAESNPAALRIKYEINPGVGGIYPIPAAESKVGYEYHFPIPLDFSNQNNQNPGKTPGINGKHW